MSQTSLNLELNFWMREPDWVMVWVWYVAISKTQFWLPRYENIMRHFQAFFYTIIGLQYFLWDSSIYAIAHAYFISHKMLLQQQRLSHHQLRI